MDQGTIIGAIIGILIGTLVSGLVIWIVAKLKLGIEIQKTGTAFVAAFLCAVVGYLLSKFSPNFGEALNSKLSATIVHIISSAIILMIVAAILPGMRIKGILGAFVAAASIGIIGWLLGTLLKATI